MAGNYFNYTPAQIAQRAPGYEGRAVLALLEWFETLAHPTGAEGEDATTIRTSHTLRPGFDWITVRVQPHTLEVPSDAAGEEGALHRLWTPKMFVQGDTPALAAMMQDLERQEFILMAEAPSCNGDVTVQFGCEIHPARIVSDTVVSGTTREGKRGYQLELSTASRCFYAPDGNTSNPPSGFIYDLLFEGDSITAFAAQNGWDSNYPSAVQTAVSAMPQYNYVSNYAVAGEIVGTGGGGNEMNSPLQIATVVAGRVAGHVPVTFLLAGVNDIQVGASAATVYARLAALHQAHNTTNPGKTIAFTIMAPRHASNAGNHAAMWVEVEALNAMIRAGYATDFGASALVDLQSDPQLGGYNAPLNLRWFPDGIHPSAAGSQRIANLALQALAVAVTGVPSIVQFNPVLQQNVAVSADVTYNSVTEANNEIVAIATTGSWGAGHGGSYLKLPQATNGWIELEVKSAGYPGSGVLAFSEWYAAGGIMTNPQYLAAMFNLVAGGSITVRDGVVAPGGLLIVPGSPVLAIGDRVRIAREGSSNTPVFKLYHRTASGTYGSPLYTFVNSSAHDLYINFDMEGSSSIYHPRAGGVVSI